MAQSGRAPLRRDAERNRARIVEAARDLVAASGLGVGHDEIARAAQVGVGTVYRRFPRREELLEELFGAQVEHVAGLARAAAGQADAWAALRRFLEEVVRLQAADRGLRELLGGSPHAPALARSARERIAPEVAGLLARSQADGRVRAEVGVADLALVPLMTAAVLAAGAGPDVAGRVLAVLLAGLEAVPGAAPLPGAPAPDEVVDRVLAGPPAGS
ncbi:TetR/AcrR family transcriptional regulator [Vallicoccus soli]|nr:TetR/AcrR family transcriptional regulator [Vallicoccus soli]